MNPLTNEPDVLDQCSQVLGMPLATLSPYHKAFIQRTGSHVDFPDFCMMAAARSHPQFLFEHTSLAFHILREPDVNVIMLGRFCRFAPIIHPLVSRQCPEIIFDALHSVPSGSDTIQERHITFASFLMYANTLKAEFVAGVKLQPHVAFLESMNLLSSPQSDKAASIFSTLRQRVVYLSTTAQRKLAISNAGGTFIITDTMIAFQSGINLQLLRRTVQFPLDRLTKVTTKQSGLFKTGHSLLMQLEVDASTGNGGADSGTDVKSADPQPADAESDQGDGNPSTLEVCFATEADRDYVQNYVEDLQLAISLGRQSSVPIIRECVLNDAIDDILRVESLRQTRFPCPIRRMTFLSTSSSTAQASYVALLATQFHDMALSCGLFTSLFGPAPSRILDDPSWEPRMLLLVDNPAPNDPPSDKLDLGLLADNAKLLSIQLAPLEVVANLHRQLIEWRNPMATLTVMLSLLFLAYMDWLALVPAFLVLANFVLLWMLSDQPEMLAHWYDRQMGKRPAVQDPPSQTPTEPPGGIGKLLDNSVLGKFKSKVDGYQQSFLNAKSALEVFQNRLQFVNHYLLKLKGLYFWLSPLRSRQFMAANALLFAVLLLLPFRLIFACVVLAHFTEHFRNDSGVVDRFIRSIPLASPPQIRKP
ncbi:Uncharacterized protein PBTT_04860 [Plasmodiophora brassicae]